MGKIKDRHSRSSYYQYSIVEVGVDYGFLSETFDNSQSTHPPEEQIEQIYILNEQYKKRAWELLKSNTTEIQYSIVFLIANGYTQLEVAKILKRTQSSIAQTIIGNRVYHNGVEIRLEGGVVKKMRDIAKKDYIIQDIINKIKELL